jgi:hypothetical protein
VHLPDHDKLTARTTVPEASGRRLTLIDCLFGTYLAHRTLGAEALQWGGRVRMTDIDPQADIEVHSADEHVTVGVPLAGAVTGEWLRCYQKLALAKEVPVQPQVHDDRAWIVVSMPDCRQYASQQ